MTKRIRGGLLALVAAVGAVFLASRAPAQAQAALTVGMVNHSWAELGPPPNPGSSNFLQQYMNAVYGELFHRNPDGSVVPSLAQSYNLSQDGLTLTVTIRDGVKFQDGTDFNANAVLEQWKRALDPANSCGCRGSFTAVKSVEASGKNVIMNLSRPDPTIVQSIIGQQLNWVPSPAAYAATTRQQFGLKPVGAGPFQVVSQTPGSELILKKFDGYWKKGTPKLGSLTFINLGDDQSAYAALQAGSVQLVLGITSANILERAGLDYQLSNTPGVAPYQLLFNTTKPPFNDIRARQAVAYVTMPDLVLKASSPGFGELTQTPSGPGGLYYQRDVKGTITYDVEKAKALVKELGGLQVLLNYPTNSPIYLSGSQALGTMWQAAGIQVLLAPWLPATSAQANASGNWTMQFTTAGGFDPSAGLTGFANRYGVNGSLSDRKNDPALEDMIAKAAVELDSAKRGEIVKSIYEYLNKQAYSVNLFSVPNVAVAVKNLKNLEAAAISTSGKEMIYWENVEFASK